MRDVPVRSLVAVIWLLSSVKPSFGRRPGGVQQSRPRANTATCGTPRCGQRTDGQAATTARLRGAPSAVAVDVAGLAAGDDRRCRLATGPAFAQQLEQGVGRMRAGGAERAIDHERRHRADAEPGRGLLVLAHFRGEAVAGEHLAHLVLTQPDLTG